MSVLRRIVHGFFDSNVAVPCALVILFVWQKIDFDWALLAGFVLFSILMPLNAILDLLERSD